MIPAEQLRRTLAGRIVVLDLTLSTLAKNSADLQITAPIVDPKGLVKSVMVHVAPASAGTIRPTSDGTWPPLPDTKAFELRRNLDGHSASGHVPIALRGEGAAAREILIQAAHSDAGGRIVYYKPREIELPEWVGRVMMSNPIPRMLRTAQRKSFSMLGPLVDPDNDCRLVKDEERYMIKIEVPGNKLHTLAPQVMTLLDKKKPLHNAPMSLIEVEGDFAALVQVTGEMSPGRSFRRICKAIRIPFTFQGAGSDRVPGQGQLRQTRENGQDGRRAAQAGPQGLVRCRERREERRSELP